MKLKAFIILLMLSILIPVFNSKAASTPSNLKGRILLQVESKGEAWYVNPKDGLKYYMANGNEAFQIMKTLGVGISNKDIEKMKSDAIYRKKFIGKILLQVESHGEAYYISFDGRYNYLKDGASAYEVMRKLGLGISNKDLGKISSHQNLAGASKEIDCGRGRDNGLGSPQTEIDCFYNNMIDCVKSKIILGKEAGYADDTEISIENINNKCIYKTEVKGVLTTCQSQLFSNNDKADRKTYSQQDRFETVFALPFGLISESQNVGSNCSSTPIKNN